MILPPLVFPASILGIFFSDEKSFITLAPGSRWPSDETSPGSGSRCPGLDGGSGQGCRSSTLLAVQSKGRISDQMGKKVVTRNYWLILFCKF